MQNINLLRKDLSQIKEFGIVSIFWITDTNARAKRVTWLENHGFIVRNRNDKRDAFPYCVFDVTAKRLTKRVPDAGAACDISNIIKAVALSARTVSPSKPQRR